MGLVHYYVPVPTDTATARVVALPVKGFSVKRFNDLRAFLGDNGSAFTRLKHSNNGHANNGGFESDPVHVFAPTDPGNQ